MNPVAQRSDWQRLSTELIEAHRDVLHACERNNLTCRCEMIGRDFTIVVGRGLSSAKYWLDMYDGHDRARA